MKRFGKRDTGRRATHALHYGRARAQQGPSSKSSRRFGSLPIRCRTVEHPFRSAGETPSELTWPAYVRTERELEEVSVKSCILWLHRTCILMISLGIVERVAR